MARESSAVGLMAYRHGSLSFPCTLDVHNEIGMECQASDERLSCTFDWKHQDQDGKQRRDEHQVVEKKTGPGPAAERLQAVPLEGNLINKWTRFQEEMPGKVLFEPEILSSWSSVSRPGRDR